MRLYKLIVLPAAPVIQGRVLDIKTAESNLRKQHRGDLTLYLLVILAVQFLLGFLSPDNVVYDKMPH
ncbi:MAG: hypothetical protein AB7F28_05840 [Candidatus Margulisiibacteriota bacterium]